MILVVPFTYLFLCLLTAVMVQKTKRPGFWVLFVSSLFLTPFLVFIFSAFLKDKPKAYCMMPYDNFEVGSSYYYTLSENKGQMEVTVYCDKAIRMDLHAFNDHFSMIEDKETEGKRSSERLV